MVGRPRCLLFVGNAALTDKFACLPTCAQLHLVEGHALEESPEGGLTSP